MKSKNPVKEIKTLNSDTLLRKNQKIIITGANGFLGSNLYSFLKKKNKVVKLSFLKFSKLDDKYKDKYLNKLFYKHKPHVVIHLATFFSKKKIKKL